MSIKVSFCIPTYNFGAFIGATLRSIIDQADERVQIVIVDGGSSDNTADIVAGFTSQFPRIKFIQRDKRYGIDLDILETVLQADGEYCWLFSSDDLLVPGAISRAMCAIDGEGVDLLLMGMTICNLTMDPLHVHPVLDCAQPQTFDWSDRDQRVDYFCRAQTTTAFFSFISDILVRRERWLATPTVERFIGSCWIIAAKVFGMSQQGLRVRFDPAIYVLKRSDNDSFAAQGILRRITLSIQGFRDLAEYFFGTNSLEAKQVSRVVGNEYPFTYMLELKRQVFLAGHSQDRQEFHVLSRRHYWEGGLGDRGRYALLRFTPLWALIALRHVYRLFLTLHWKSTQR